MSATAQLKKHLDAALRVSLTDGRVIIGRFSCYDKQQNVLLTDAREFRSPDCTGQSRNIGIVLVPRRWIVACHAESSDSERDSPP